MSHRTTEVWIRASSGGDYLANVCFPRHPGDKCRGWHQARRSTPQEAAKWLAGVIENHLTKRAVYLAERRKKRQAPADSPALAGSGNQVEPV